MSAVTSGAPARGSARRPPARSGRRESRPCGRTSARSARTSRRCATTRRSLIAAPIAIGTTSSLLPSSGWCPRWPGARAPCTPAVSAAAVTCAIMKPELHARRRGRGRAAAPDEVRVARAGRRAARSWRARSASRSRARRAPSATGCPWKLPPVSISPVLREDERVVGHRVDLDGDAPRATYPSASRAAPCTCGMQRRRVGVLHARIARRGATRGSALPSRSARRPRPQTRPGRGAAGPRGCARRRRRRCPRRLERHRAGDVARSGSRRARPEREARRPPS